MYLLRILAMCFARLSGACPLNLHSSMKNGYFLLGHFLAYLVLRIVFLLLILVAPKGIGMCLRFAHFRVSCRPQGALVSVVRHGLFFACFFFANVVFEFPAASFGIALRLVLRVFVFFSLVFLFVLGSIFPLGYFVPSCVVFVCLHACSTAFRLEWLPYVLVRIMHSPLSCAWLYFGAVLVVSGCFSRYSFL